MSNLFEKAIAAIAPGMAVKRAHNRKILSYYEAASPSQTRKARREPGSGNVALQRAGTSLREQARHLEQNHDIAAGALDALVTNTVGPSGIGVEPQPRNLAGEIHDVFAHQLSELWRDWQKRPEVTWQHDWASCQRMLARTWYRDGEAFNQVIEGINPYLDHGTKVPLSLEMLEPDYIPLTLMSNSAGILQNVQYSGTIVQGIEINSWGKPIGYWIYKEHPADFPVLLSSTALKRIPAGNIQHIATRSRIRQLRGVTRFATVLARLDDLKDYEESERVAAKVAASMAAFIKKGAPDDYVHDENAAQRNLKFRPGMVFDDLKVGEEIGMIDTNRPNPNLETYRSGQLRAAAGGIGLTYSVLAKNYNGSYSSQRQELIEGYGAYGVLSSEFGARIVRPTYERFVAMAVAARLIKIPADLNMETLDACLLIPPQMPWIDPEKEANANAILEDRCYISAPEIIRKRGGNPSDVLAQQAQWRKKKSAAGIPEVAQASAPASPPNNTDNSNA